MKQSSEYWVEIADYDLETARAMLSTKRYLYVGFMCHQVIEKILKAKIVESTNTFAPMTHNLAVLAEKSGLASQLSTDQKELLRELTPLNIESRYPSYLDALAKTMTRERSTELIERTNQFYLWTKQRL